MVKTEFEITIGDFNIIEKTGKLKHLVKGVFKHLPIMFSIKQIERTIKACEKLINTNNLDDSISDMEHKTKIAILIAELEVLYIICQSHLVNGIELKLILKGINLPRRSRRKLKFNKSNSLNEALVRIEKKYKKVETLNDLVKFKKFVERKRDKYNEMYPQKKASGEKHYLIDAAMSYAAYMGNTNGVSDMSFQDYIALKKNADAKIAAEKEQRSKMIS